MADCGRPLPRPCRPSSSRGGVVIYLPRLCGTSFLESSSSAAPHSYRRSAAILLPSSEDGTKTPGRAPDLTRATGCADSSRRRKVPARGSRAADLGAPPGRSAGKRRRPGGERRDRAARGWRSWGRIKKMKPQVDIVKSRS
jgi:hypothetical protein